MYFRVRTKNKKGHHGEIKGLLLIVGAFLLGYCLVLPTQVGALGQAVSRLLFLFFGQAAFLLPLFIVRSGWQLLRPSLQGNHWRLDLIWTSLMMLTASTFLSLFGTFFYSLNYGGWLGVKLNPFFHRLFNYPLSLLITAGVFVYLGALLMRVSLKHLLILVWHKLVEDYEEWKKAREEWKKSIPPKIKTQEQADLRPSKAEPRIRQPEPAAAAAPEPKIVTPARTPMPPAERPHPPQAPVKKTVPPAERRPGSAGAAAGASSQESLPVVPLDYKLPPLELLSDSKGPVVAQSQEEHLANAALLTRTLADFDITAKVQEIIPGPVVTRYDMELAPGIKVQAVVALSENIALVMKAPSVRVVSIPEKSAVGVEVPNVKSSIVGLKGILASPEFTESRSLLMLAMGRTTDGAPYATDLMPMPHLLIAGATGSGKSVGIHSIILSILYRARPDEVKLMIIDPKRLEMPIYRGLPHLYDPRVPADKVSIITQPKDAAESLKKLVRVMEMRYEKFAQYTVRNIEGYNEKMAQEGKPKEFYIVVIIDELADLMMIATKEVEDAIQRLAQMARAVGIHLILATQRPSVDVITGVIKANFPSRIAFQTTSKVDSRVILDTMGADALLGRGDMLFLPPGESRPTRLQGAFVSVKEAEQVVNFIRQQNVPPSYENMQFKAAGGTKSQEEDESAQELIEALRLVQERKRVSQDLLKAHFGSSARATNLLSLLETRGFIHKPEGTNRWTIHFDRIEEYIAASGTGDAPMGGSPMQAQ